MPRIINFSGGRTSAMMTILEYNPQTDYVLFCDTGREHDKTYKFINDFEAYEKIPIIRIGGQSAFDDYLKKINYRHLPNIQKRSCTIELKVKPARRWARENIGMEYLNLIGFRYDEPQRVNKNKNRWQKVKNIFPLFERKINKQQVLDFWKNKPYDLEIPSILGNCTLCFMKGRNATISILKHFPELAEKWIQDEELTNYQYHKDLSIKQLLSIAQMPDLFSQNLENITSAYDCSCTT